MSQPGAEPGAQPLPEDVAADAALQRASCLVRSLATRLGARVVETHISWVLLGAHEAWKLKKPLRLPFVDYGSLARRRDCCLTEVDLNRRYAPEVYLGVQAIVGTPEAPRLVDDVGTDANQAIEYAVQMRRFDDEALWSRRLPAGRLTGHDVDALSRWLAGVHASARRLRCDDQAMDAMATPRARRDAALAALDGARPWLDQDEADRLQGWLEARSSSLARSWAQRREAGQVRECHGDLHLANLLTLDAQVQAFDGIEFDPALRWIDVVDDLAFPVMDLQAHGRRDLAFRLLDGWLMRTGDVEGLPALRFAVVYRALVRTMACSQRGDVAAGRACLDTALRWIDPPAPSLAITMGLPGSGKSTRALQWALDEGGVRLRSDVERKRLFGLDAIESSRDAGLDIYDAAATARTYDRLLQLARAALTVGYPVVIDAANLRRHERERMLDLATDLGVPCSLIACEAPVEELRRRIVARSGDASEADVAVLERLARCVEPVGPAERARYACFDG